MEHLRESAPRVVAEVVIGMHHLHEHCGIIHRDLKPENVLLTAEVSILLRAQGTACIGLHL